jgi:serine/threonine protein kinase
MYLLKGNKLNNRYTIEEKLESGSYGIIYKAKDNNSRNLVAIKTLRDLEYKKNLGRFKKEIKALKELSGGSNPHPNIVKYHDEFSEGQKHYLVMEYLNKKTLYTLIKDKNRKKLPYRLAFRYICQIGSALKAAHEEDWIHRDVHPGNIMIVGKKAVLIDFGIVRNRRLLTNEHPAGNHYFAPPEQRDGGDNPKLDIYALAACLYYALTGECPTSSKDRSYGIDLIPPKKYNRSIKKEVEDAILKGMELKPEERPASIEEWLKLLPKTWYWYWQELIEARWLTVNWLNRFFER